MSRPLPVWMLFGGAPAVRGMVPIASSMMHGPHDTESDGNHWIPACQ